MLKWINKKTNYQLKYDLFGCSFVSNDNDQLFKLPENCIVKIKCLKLRLNEGAAEFGMLASQC